MSQPFVHRSHLRFTYRPWLASLAILAACAGQVAPLPGQRAGQISVTPATAQLAVGAARIFQAQVSGLASDQVSWGTTGGIISADGHYQAPDVPGVYQVVATAAADASLSATAMVTVTAVAPPPPPPPPPVVAVTVSPSSVAVAASASAKFTAAVSGASNTAVTWAAARGAITPAGVYTAPATAGADTVTATSAADATQSASAAVTVTAVVTGGGAPVKLALDASLYSGGYTGTFTVTNSGTSTISGWTLTFSTTDTITSIWNVTDTVSGAAHTVTPVDFAKNIAAGSSQTFGFSATTVASGGWAPPAAALFNGASYPVTASTTGTGSGGGTSNAPAIGVLDFDTASKAALQITLPQGSSSVKLALKGGATPSFAVASNNPSIATVAVSGANLLITTTDVNGGRAGLRITEAGGAVRYVGLRLRDAAGALPGFPKRISVGVVSEDTDADLGMFKAFGAGDKNRFVDNRYIYLNGGPINGWYTWSGTPGDRARSYVRNSLSLGLIPTFVWYNLPDGGESYPTDLCHVRDGKSDSTLALDCASLQTDPTYMRKYFELWLNTFQILQDEAPDELVMFILEPDFLGYMMQNYPFSGAGGVLDPSEIFAHASAARDAGALGAGDPVFPDTLPGLVQTINYVIHKHAPQARFGWQFNVWATLAPLKDGYPQTVAPKDLMKVTDPDQLGWTEGRKVVARDAGRIARFYLAAGVATNGASLISFDKYGLDAVGYQSTAAADPNGSTWFFNSDHWSNYLLLVKTIHELANLPVALWQLPVGRINSTKEPNPYAVGGAFADLDNTTNRYEDSTPSWFFGDTFAPGSRLGYFAANAAGDAGLHSTSATVTWPSHLAAARDAGVFNLMFGDGVGQSTRARPVSTGADAPDGWWLMVKAQRYFQSPVLLP